MSNLELAIVATISKNVQQNRKCKYKYKYEFLQICLILRRPFKQEYFFKDNIFHMKKVSECDVEMFFRTLN